MSKRNSGNNPEEKTDLRIRRTKKSIRDAFFELIDENGFDSVTVKDITDRALISRNTFYLHYEDKFDLLNKISNELSVLAGEQRSDQDQGSGLYH